jgi:hypothetical protein
MSKAMVMLAATANCIGLMFLGASVNGARAQILHAYLLVESQAIDENRLRDGLGRDLGMCKYVVIGSTGTEAGGQEWIVRLDCQRQDDLNKLIVQAGSGIEGVTKASVVAVSRWPR